MLITLCFLYVFGVHHSNGFVNFSNTHIKFLGCEHIEDDTLGLKAKDKTEYNFIFNSSHTFSSYEVETCETDQLLQCKSTMKTSNCQVDTSLFNRISCGVIKGSIYPEIKRDIKVDLKFVIFGKNDSGRYAVLENQHQYVLCELRGCNNDVDAVKFVEGSNEAWKPRTKQLQFELENIPVFTSNIFGQFLYDIVLLNDTYELNVLTRNLTNTNSNMSKKKYVLDNFKDSCISSFDKMCVVTRWTFCGSNKTDLWQTSQFCQSINYADFFPKFIPQCMAEKNEVKIVISLSDGPNQPLFYDFLIERKSVSQNVVRRPKTKNLAIPVAGGKGDIYSVSICDDCSCSPTLHLTCSRPNIPASTNDNIKIILGVTLTLVVLLVLVGVLYIVWKKQKKAKEKLEKNDAIFEAKDLPEPRNEYKDAEMQEQEPHKYFNVTTQEVE